MGVMYGQPIEYLVQRTSRHQQSTAPACNQQRRTAANAPTTSHRTSSSSSSSSSSHPVVKRPRYSNDDREVGAAPAAGGKGMTSQNSSSQPTDKKQPVEQYDLATNRTIARFDSQRDADRATGINHANISSCIRGKTEHAGGFGWRTPGSGGVAARPALSVPSTGTYS